MIDAVEHDFDAAPYAAVRDLPALAEFAVVARWEHMTRAAEELRMPQPTLSRRIGRLELALGVPLFTRRGRALELTRAGRALAVVVDRALLDLGRGLAGVTRSLDPETGTVVLAFLNTLGVAVVPHILREFRDHHPAVVVQLVQEGHDAALDRLRHGEVDVALTAPLPRDPSLTTLPLHRQPLRLAVPVTHPLADRDDVRLADVAGEPFVGFKAGYGMRSITEEWCGRAGFTPALAFEGEDVATVRGLVGAGLGVALVPADRRPAEGIVELVVRDQPVSRTIGMVTAADRPATPPAATFLGFLTGHGARLVAEVTEGLTSPPESS